jgi:hypothetical protein
VAGVTLMHLKSRQSVRERKCVMGSSQRYFEYAQECSRWAAEAEERSTQDLFFEMAKASTVSLRWSRTLQSRLHRSKIKNEECP